MKLQKKLFRRYLVNLNTREIHRVSHITDNCCIGAMKEDNAVYRSRRKAKKLIKSGIFNGCRFCWKEKDNG